ncbi:MAG: diguanylate cyclase [Sulfuricella sp.]|nr:diguanylate cyclase [Sulfuricella sp.]
MSFISTSFRPFFGFRLATLIFLLVVAFPALATPPRVLRFESIGDQDGVNGQQILALLQDRQGFIWMGTERGLARYDGYRFINYRNDPENLRSLPDDYVSSLFEDQRGRIWVGTRSGLARVDSETGGFTRFVADAEQHSGNLVRKLIDDGKGGMWLATYGGLQHFNPDDGHFRVYRHDPSSPDSIASDNLSALALDEKGGLWIGAWPGSLDYLAPGTATFRHFSMTISLPSGLRKDNVRALRFDHSHRLWIGTDRGVITWQPDGDDWSQRKYVTSPLGLDDLWVNNIYEDSEAIIWVATRATGLLRWDDVQQKFIVYRHNLGDPHSLQYDYIESLMQDRLGVLWVGSYGGGLSRVNLANRGFEHLTLSDSRPGEERVNNIIIYGIAGNKDGHLWLGTGNGLHLFDPTARKLIKSFYHDPKRPGSLSNSRVNSVFLASNGVLWAATPSGLNRLDVAAGRFRVVHFGDSASDFINTIIPSRDGSLWLGTAGGLIRFEPKSGAVIRKYSHDPSDPHSRSVNSTSVVLEDRAGQAWAGGWYSPGGLDLLDSATGRFRHFRRDPQNPASLQDDIINTLFEDNRGTLWVATGKGLNQLVFEPGGRVRFRLYSVKEGVASNSIGAIKEDAAGQIWMATKAGLSRLDPGSGKISNFFPSEGIADGGFFSGAAYRAQDGTLYFGGYQGLTIVRPEEVRLATKPPIVVLTGIGVPSGLLHDDQREENVSLEGKVGHPKSLTLSWRESLFSLEFSALHYADPRRNRYAYRLEGFDRDWVETDATHRTATYTNLDPGEYVFRVKASNHKGVWNETGLTLPITITPPFWKTGWFRLIVALLLLALGAAAYRWRINRLKRTQFRLEQLVRESTRQLAEKNNELSEAYQALVVTRDEALRASAAKSEFLANMSHEIRTPMNAIVGMTQLALQNELAPKLRNYLEKVDGAAKWLLGIINDILDFSKIEAGKVEFEHRVFFLDGVVARLKDMLAIRAQGKGLLLCFEVGSDVPRVLVGDAMRLGQVLTNLVNNAIKFTEKGEISVAIRRVANKTEGVWLHFSVRDSGVGLSEEQCQRLFSPFTQADSSTTRKYGGTGLGLSISKRLVEMMEGEIGVESRLGVGSTFFFTARFDEEPEQAEPQTEQPVLPDVAQSLRGARLLLVEDNAVNQELALELLNNVGIHVDVANNGVEALDRLEHTHYDGVLMDCQMPVMDGFEATRKIRADARFANLPVIAMSAGVTVEDREMCRKSGMNDYIAKPIYTNTLFSTLVRWITTASFPPEKVEASETHPETEVPRLAGVNTEEGLACVNGNVALYRKILKSFRNDQADVVARIREACRFGEWENAVRLAHTLRGLAGNVGADGLVGIARALETTLRNQRDEQVAPLLDALDGSVEALLGEIDRVMPQSRGAAENLLVAEGNSALESAPGQEARLTLLVVDDTRQNIELLCAALGPDYQYQIAMDGESALRIATSESKPDLVLLDVMMPGMSGYEVCQALKSNPDTRRIPVVFVTALGEPVEEEMGLSLGAVDFITKPLRPPVVRARVRNLLNLKKKADLLESQAFLDPLTVIPNRRSFDEALQVEWLRAQRSGKPLTVIMVDVDNFKSYNDCYGHGEGDICLKAVASELAVETVLRPADLVARLGGEEFVVLLPDTDIKGGRLIAERLRRNIEALHIPHQRSGVSSWVTISAGYASMVSTPDVAAAELMAEADRMLYQAKASGRNAVCGPGPDERG